MTFMDVLAHSGILRPKGRGIDPQAIKLNSFFSIAILNKLLGVGWVSCLVQAGSLPHKPNQIAIVTSLQATIFLFRVIECSKFLDSGVLLTAKKREKAP